VRGAAGVDCEADRWLGCRPCSSMSDLMSKIPVGVLSDSYKAGHFLMYPDAEKMCAVRATCSPAHPPVPG
jgi:hypothetical protein